MTLVDYFENLIVQVENSDIQNNGKDKNGFFQPTRSVLMQKLNLLKDLHAKPHAKAMVKEAWAFVVETVPPDWLIVPAELKPELAAILK